jgi:hypothetical protein
MNGSNIIEFRIARKWNDESQTIKNDERLQFRTKDVIISVLGVSLGSWSEWKDFDALEIVNIVG